MPVFSEKIDKAAWHNYQKAANVLLIGQDTVSLMYVQRLIRYDCYMCTSENE